MEVEIRTIDKLIAKEQVKSVKLPGKLSSFTVLYNHAPIISTLNKGKIILKLKDDSIKEFDIDGGIVEVKKNKISVILT